MEVEISKQAKIFWRKIILSHQGQEIIRALEQSQPSIGGGEPHAIIFQAGVSEGHRRAIAMLTQIVAAEEQSDTELENR